MEYLNADIDKVKKIMAEAAGTGLNGQNVFDQTYEGEKKKIQECKDLLQEVRTR